MEFRAGKMVFYGKKILPDSRKGLVRIGRDGPRDVMIHVAGSSGDPDEEDISNLLQSRPFRQQVDSFTYVLRTGQIDLSQFEINPSKCEWSVAPEPVA
ncbi:hypothetical protein NC651_039216 [Populus alba x Populus x berolinensis]|nr:hypothetical protein NC651_039216 [Populus alba x Populus x berolinensis]